MKVILIDVDRVENVYQLFCSKRNEINSDGCSLCFKILLNFFSRENDEGVSEGVICIYSISR